MSTIRHFKWKMVGVFDQPQRFGAVAWVSARAGCRNRLGSVWVSRMNPCGFRGAAPAPKPTPGQWMRAVLAINSEALHNRCSTVARPLPNRCATVKAPLQQQGVRVTRTLVLCVPAARTGAYLGTPSVQELSSRCAILRSRLLLGINSSDSASSRLGQCPCPASAPGWP